MKKLVLTLSLVVVTGSSLLAQGNFLFTTTARYVWDNWSSAAIKGDASNNIAFLWAVSGTPTVAGVATSIATNIGVNGLSSANLTTAWTDILTDPNYHFATNSGTSALVQVQATGTGAINYLSAATFGVLGTSSSGGAVQAFVVAWSSAYATPALAAAANAPLGWSSVFTYNYASSIGTPGNFSSGGLVPFGVTSAAVVAPEPSTMALAALGGASLLLFRRRK
ncbi:MAG: PEP-CTERM sorting domain-containing protein [Verrucomicrobiota bacterium]